MHAPARDAMHAPARDAMRDFVAIPYNARGALITYQASFVGLDKKISNPIGLLNFLVETSAQAPRGI